MKGQERLNKFIQLQNKNLEFNDISKEIGIAPTTLKKFLNKMGYKFENGKYISKQTQITFETIKENNKDNKEKKDKKSINKKTKNNKENVKKEVLDKKVNTNKKSIKTNAKKDRKINITQDDLDKLCEVYDWYLEVKDYKSMKPKKTSNKKDVSVEDVELKETKGTSIKVEKNTWEEFERLCSNSQYNKQQIITQALKDFMKEYKHLL
ncbi:MAG: DNA-binding protein [Peptostreptococcaceae bacterium]